MLTFGVHNSFTAVYMDCASIRYSIKLNSTERLYNNHFRCMLSSTPSLLTGYDMCLVGEMYIRQDKKEEGVRKLKDGLDVLFLNIRQEPLGDRRTRLLQRVIRL